MNSGINVKDTILVIISMVVVVPFILPIGLVLFRGWIEKLAADKFRRLLDGSPGQIRENRSGNRVCGDEKEAVLYNCATAILMCAPFFVFAGVNALAGGKDKIALLSFSEALMVVVLYSVMRYFIATVDYAKLALMCPGPGGSVAALLVPPFKKFYWGLAVFCWVAVAYIFYEDMLQAILTGS